MSFFAFWFDLFFFIDSWGVKLIVPYIYENNAPRIFNLFSRNLRNEKWIFPLGNIVFLRVIDNKILLANSNLDFVFLSVNLKLVLMSFQLEMKEIEMAFEIVKNESFDLQFSAAKAFYVF